MRRLFMLLTVMGLLFGGEILVSLATELVEVILRHPPVQIEPVTLTSNLVPGRLECKELLVSNPTKEDLDIKVKVESWMDIHPSTFKIKAGAKQRCLLFYWLTNEEKDVDTKVGKVYFMTSKGEHASIKVTVFGPMKEKVSTDHGTERVRVLELQIAEKDAKIKELEKCLSELETEKTALSERLTSEINVLKEDIERKVKEYLSCAEEKERLEELSEKLSEEIKALRDENAQQRDRIGVLEKELADCKARPEGVKYDAQIQQLYDALRGSLKDEMVRGDVILSLQERSVRIALTNLFPMGSSYPFKEKNPLITKVGMLLKANLQPNFKIEVGGHTDSLPINGVYSDNWQLSAMRALRILYILNYRKGVEIDKKHLFLAGYGSVRPIDDNSTAEGRERNRRVEIIVSLQNSS